VPRYVLIFLPSAELICDESENVFILESVLQNKFVVEILGAKQYFGQSIANLTATWR
jgi:hypothetical protein